MGPVTCTDTSTATTDPPIEPFEVTGPATHIETVGVCLDSLTEVTNEKVCERGGSTWSGSLAIPVKQPPLPCMRPTALLLKYEGPLATTAYANATVTLSGGSGPVTATYTGALNPGDTLNMTDDAPWSINGGATE